MADETYNGWTNRETWAFHLWITNEEATYHEARRVVREAASDAAERARALGVSVGDGMIAGGNALQEWWLDTLEAARENGYAATLDAMRDDVGSLWRVDWPAVADALAKEDGDTPPSPPPDAPTDDITALDRIAHMLRDPEWGVGMLEDIADLVSDTGRTIQGTCGSCGHVAYDGPDERCEADGCVCPQHEQQHTWDRH